MKIKACVAILLLQCCSAFAAHGETLYLSIAASMTDVFNEMMADFAANHRTVQFLPNFASSGSLAKQIEQGAPADIFVSANPKWMKYLVEKKLIGADNNQIFAFNQLVFIGEKKSAGLSLDDIANLERIAIGSPQNVPAGQYAKQAMESAEVYAALHQAKKLVMAKDVRQALIYADRGEVDGAFVYKTDALLAVKAQILFTVPQELYDRVAYPVALTTTGAKNNLAKAFYDYITSAQASATLAKYGFVPNR